MPFDIISYDNVLAKVSEYRLRQIWNVHFSDKPFPNVRAIVLSDEEFVKAIHRLYESPCIKDMSAREYGRKSNPETTVGIVYKTLDGYTILIKQHSRHNLDEKLEHELRHIYRGDTEKLE